MPNTAASEVLDDKLLFMAMPTEPLGDPRNPYPEYAQARTHEPVKMEYDRFGVDGPVIAYAYRHADVVRVFQDNNTFSSQALHEAMSPFMGEYVLVGMDEPAHTRYRNLLAPALRPRLLARWEDLLIHKVADELIDSFYSRGQADLVADFNFSFPAQVVARIVGVPQENFAQFQHWAMGIVGATGDPITGMQASQALRSYLKSFVENRRKEPQDDLISELVSVELNGDRLNEEEIYSFLLLLLPAGIETTFRSIGNLLFNLLSHPDQLEALRQDRSLLGNAIEEGLRFDSPIQTPLRTAVCDTEIGGVAIPKGTIVVPIIGAANHDPALNDAPDRFNIRRKNIRHITFGNGVHTCMGLHLAKLETRIAINKLLDRLPGLRLDTARVQTMDAHIRGKTFRSPTAIPVIWDI